MAHWLLSLKDFSYTKLETQFAKTGEVYKDADINARIMDNDMWLDGEGYIAPPPVQDDPNAIILWNNLQRTFTSENVIEEMVSRVKDSIFGSSADWKIELSPEAQREADANKPPPVPVDPNAPPVDPIEGEEDAEAVIDPLVSEAETLLTTYWDNSDILEVLRGALEDRLVRGRGAVRVYVPKRFRNEDGSIKTEIKTLADALQIIRVEKVQSDNARILDEEGEKVSLYKGKRIRDYETGETEDVFEFSFVDDAGLTFVGTVSRDVGGVQPATALQPALKVAIAQRDACHAMLASQLLWMLGRLDQTPEVGRRGHGDVAHLAQLARHHMRW